MPRRTELRRLFLLVVLPLLVSCAHAPRSAAPPGPPRLTWKLVIDEHLAVTEHLCWNGFTPAAIKPEMDAGLRFARAVVPKLGPEGCATIVVDMNAMARTLDADASLVRAGDAIYGSFDPWLWRPDPWPAGLVGALVVEAPPGITLALPHDRLREEAGRTVYAIPLSTWTFMARMALGRLTVDAIDAAGARFSIVRLPGAAPRASAAGLRRMIEGAASAVATVDGRMPVTRAQVLVGAGRGHGGDAADPVVFGMAMRGGGATVSLRLSQGATDDALFGEWIATHELSHLWLPPVDRDAAWLSEGLASYYQGVLRSRVGMLEEARAWSELVAGFKRGRAQAGDLRLRDARRPRFQQIYWGGAAILFKLDVALRRRGLSLDAAIAGVTRAMSRDPARLADVTADEMVAQLERALGDAAPLRPSVDRWLDQPFPDTSDELRELGIRPADTGPPTLDDDAPLAAVRRGIAGLRRASALSRD